jgi:hypothetical protein
MNERRLHLGVTATQAGISDRQREWFADFVMRLRPKYFHHGLCIGGDYQCHLIVRALLPQCIIVGHPPVNPVKLAASIVDDCDTLMPAKAYADRNHDIVDAIEHLVVLPRQRTEIMRSGTWMTARYARKQYEQGVEISITIVDP